MRAPQGVRTWIGKGNSAVPCVRTVSLVGLARLLGRRSSGIAARERPPRSTMNVSDCTGNNAGACTGASVAGEAATISVGVGGA